MDKSQESRLKRIFESFEDAWSSQNEPDISNFVQQYSEADADQLVEELIRRDLDHRNEKGLENAPEIYASLGTAAVSFAAEYSAQLSPHDKRGEVDLSQNEGQSPPTQIGPYQLVQKLGEGGMGTVWLADQLEPVRRQVAIKLIKSSLASKPIIARFEAERQALAMMDHPNIAKVLDAGTTASGSPYFVMELVQGIPINEYCDRKKLTPDDRLELFVSVCNAVQHAHQKGIIHRDLKPSNVLVQDREGIASVKVIDFGLAKALQHQTRLTDKTLNTEFGQVLGTLQYMSPEQAMMDALNVDTRSDIYSLGVMLYELLAGSTPIDVETLNQNALLKVLEVIREEDPPLPSQRLSSSGDKSQSISDQRQIQPVKLQRILRGELDWVVMKALAKDRTRRYETADAFAKDIQRYLTGDPVAARPPSASYRIGKFVRKNTGLVASIATIAALLIAGLGGTSWFAYQSSQEAIRANREAKRATKETERAVEAEELAKLEADKAKASAEQSKRDKIAAEKSAKRSKDSLEIFTSSFKSVDPWEGADAQMLAKDVLFNAYEKLKKSDLDDEGKAVLLTALTNSFAGIGEYNAAIVVARADVNTRKSLQGPKHTSTLNSMGNLALCLRLGGQADKALVLDQQLLDLRREVFGSKHPDVLMSMASLAESFENTGQPRNALKLKQEVLQLRKENLGLEHEDTLFSMNNLSVSLLKNGQADKALKLCKQVVDLRQEKNGNDHPETLISMNNLAACLMTARKFPDAIKMFQRVLKLRQTKLGFDHPDTLTTLNSLAASYYRNEQSDEALQLFRQALELRRQKLGDDHPDTMRSLNNLGFLYDKTGQDAESLKIYTRLLEQRREILGWDHPETLTTLNNLSAIYSKQKSYSEALRFNQQVLDRRREKLGTDHPSTLNTMSNRAAILAKARQHSEAIKVYQELIEARRKRLGRLHSDTMLSIGNLAGAFREAGQVDRQLETLKKLLELKKEKFEPGHPETLSLMKSIAEVLIKARRYEEALELTLELCTLHREKHGQANPDTEKALKYIAVVYLRLKDEHAEHWLTFHAQSLLGNELMKIKKYEQSKPLLEGGFKGLKTRTLEIPRAKRSRLTDAVSRLIELAETTENDADLKKWQKEKARLELEFGPKTKPSKSDPTEKPNQ